MRELVINGICYAKYQIEGKTIFLKVINEIVKGDKAKSENKCIQIIELIENTLFEFAAYLNI